MKKIISRIIPCLLIVLVVLGVANCKSCKKAETYSYPTVTPLISNAKDTFVKIGDYKVTNDQVYHRLLQSYGVNTLSSLVDDVIFADYKINEDDYIEYLDKYIYNTDDPSTLTEEEKAELKVEFAKKMLSLGLETEQEWRDYYLVEYKKIQYALDKYKAYITEYDADEDNEDPFFKDSDYETYYNNNYHGTVSVIILTFDSIVEANSMLKGANIDTNSLFGNWKYNDGTELTNENIINTFKNLYSLMHNGASDAITTYTYEDLYAISSTITQKAFALGTYDSEKPETLTSCYTHGPLLFGSRYYLLLKTGETEPEKTLEEVKTEIYDALVDSSISTYYIAAKANEARYDAGLKIFDEGLECLYKTSYDSVYSSLKQTEYNAFEKTTEESNKIVATFTYKDKVYNITADEMFNALVKDYGIVLTSLLVQQYIVLNNRDYNNVYDYIKDEILDQTTFDTYVKSEITEYKEAFLAGEYASSGYPANYGWENFLKDFLGVFSERELIVNLDSGLYTASLENLGKTLYMSEATEDTLADAKVQAEMKRIYDNFFGGAVTGLYTYYDNDINSLADGDLTTEQVTLAQELISLLYNEAKAINGKTFVQDLTDVVKVYNMATISNSKYGNYKLAGLRVNVMASTTYTTATTADEKIIAGVKELWTLINNEAETNSLQSTLMGVSLDPGVRTVIDSTVHYYTAEDFADKVAAITTDKGVYRLVMTNATKRTALSTKKVDDVETLVFPTLAEYENYLLDDKDENKTTVSTTLKGQITAYYTVAIANLATDTAKTNLLMDKSLALLPSVTFTKDSERSMRILEGILNASIVKED